MLDFLRRLIIVKISFSNKIINNTILIKISVGFWGSIIKTSINL